MDNIFKFRVFNQKDNTIEYIDNLYWFEENGISEIVNGEAHSVTGTYNIDRCTGKTDSEGNLIYEHDILLSPDSEDGYWIKIEWFDDIAAFDIYTYGDGWEYKLSDDTMEDVEYFTIVGNVWTGVNGKKI